ncbi:MAG: hypothetical protein GX808_04460 [Syntrophomonadaceae bacterium]|nr:hypothetical protein [Syntrophomonadaceae bacterium]
MFKKVMVALLAVSVMMAFASCGVKQSVDDKIAEKVTEGVLNKATGGDAKVDIKDGEMTFEGEDGEKFTIGADNWPTGDAAGQLPEFKGGKIVSALNSAEACVIIIEEVKQQDFEEYVEEIKGQGFENEVSEITTESSYMYSASLDNKTIFAQYESEAETMSINLQISGQ